MISAPDNTFEFSGELLLQWLVAIPGILFPGIAALAMLLCTVAFVDAALDRRAP